MSRSRAPISRDAGSTFSQNSWEQLVNVAPLANESEDAIGDPQQPLGNSWAWGAILGIGGTPQVEAPERDDPSSTFALGGDLQPSPVRGAGLQPENQGLTTEEDNARRDREARDPDERLRHLQSRAADSMLRDVYRRDPQNRHRHVGMIEDGTDNSGEQVRRVQREAHIGEGVAAWCGAEVAHHYGEVGPAFRTRQDRLASDQKAREFFLYQPQRLRDDATRAQRAAASQREAQTHQAHIEQGSTRRYMTYRQGHPDVGPQPGGGQEEVYGDPSRMPVRRGDTVVMDGHVAMVENYHPDGTVDIIEGNAGGNGGRDRVCRRSIPVSDPSIRGFGRPALGDLEDRGRRAAGQR